MHARPAAFCRTSAIGLALAAVLVGSSGWAEVFPPGRTELQRTVVTPYAFGGLIQGYGLGSLAEQYAHPTESTSLVWRGEPGQAVVDLRGLGTTVKDIAIHGKPSREAADGDRAGVGIAIRRLRGTRGVGNGKHTIGPVLITRCDAAVQVGDATGDRNCDESHFTTLHVHHCGVGVRLLNTMALGHTFDYVRAMGVEAIFEVRAGGNLLANRVAAMGPMTVLKIDAARRAVGSNNATYWLHHVKFDQKAGPRGMLVDMKTGAAAKVVSYGGHIAYDGYAATDARVAIMRSSGELTLRDWYNLQAGMLEWHAKRGKVCSFRVRDSRLACDPLELFAVGASTGTAFIEVTGCCDLSGRPLPDTKEELTGDGKRPRGDAAPGVGEAGGAGPARG
ncbi:MAG: hypothetical protein AAF790_07395 [Planctomycetota bacterium]